MKRDNEERQIPYVSKELCEYLRSVWDAPTLLSWGDNTVDPALVLGYAKGVNTLIEYLEALQREQEEGAYR